MGVLGGSSTASSAYERWGAIIEEQLRSGLSVSVFCRERSIATSSFFAWRRKVGVQGGVSTPRRRQRQGDSGFAEVKLVQKAGPAVPSASSASSPKARLELRLPGNRRLIVRTGFDCDLLIALVRTLEALA
jgi:transposase-like protein